MNQHTVDELRRSLTEAGLTLLDGNDRDGNDRDGGPHGGVRLQLINEGPPGIRVTWAVHPDLYTDLRRGKETLEVLDVMNLALMAVLTTLGWDVLPGPPGRPTLILGRRPPRQDPDTWEADQ